MRMEPAGQRRAVTFVAIGAALEVALRVIAFVAPVFRVLISPLYWIVAAAAIIASLLALRPRSGHDRRHTDRRNSNDSRPG